MLTTFPTASLAVEEGANSPFFERERLHYNASSKMLLSCCEGLQEYEKYLSHKKMEAYMCSFVLQFILQSLVQFHQVCPSVHVGFSLQYLKYLLHVVVL